MLNHLRRTPHARLSETGSFNKNTGGALQLEVSRKTVWKILKRNLLYAYHQALLPRDSHSRLIFCRWLIHTWAHNLNFLPMILLSDEANFSRDAIMNFYNYHFWADENPHVIRESHFEQ